MNSRLGFLLVIAVAFAVTLGTVVAYSPALEIAHEYSDHGGTLVDVEYDEQFDIVWSLDENGTFVGYEVSKDEVGLVHDGFDIGHALAVGDGAVYVAEANTLWEFDVAEGNLSELGTLNEHAGAMAYDEKRDVIWAGGSETVYGYDAEDGSEFARYTPHSDGIETIDVRGDYIATGTTWKPELVLYDIEQENVVLEPELSKVGGVTATHLTEDGDLVVGTRGDGADDLITAYDIESGEQLVAYRAHIFGVSEVEYEPATETIISTGGDNTVKFFDVNEGSVIEQYQHADTIFTADLDRTNSLLWFGDGEKRVGTVTALDIEDQEESGGNNGSTGDEEQDGGDGTGNESDSDTDDGSESDPGNGMSPEEESTVDAQGPGFGVLMALVAILFVTFFGLRRYN